MADSQQQRDLVHLPAVLSDEFGVSRSIAREQIGLGMVEIDGVEWKGDKLDIPIGEIDGKEITVTGRDRAFKMRFDAAKRAGYDRSF